jgi:hypothetical protein
MRIPYDVENNLRNDKKLEIMWQTSKNKVFTHIMDVQYCVSG